MFQGGSLLLLPLHVSMSARSCLEHGTHIVQPCAADHPAVLACQHLKVASSAILCLQVTDVHEEEWSYIPVGGPLPSRDQIVTAFGAAANLVHPATG